MIIGIDGKPLTLSTPCGLLHYAQNLLTQLAKQDTKNTYLIFLPKPVSLPLRSNIVPIIGFGGPWQIVLPLLAKKHHTDIFHFLHQHGSVFFSHPRIITTLHDLADSRAYPSIFSNVYFGMLARYVALVRHLLIKKTHTFIAISNTVKAEFEKKYFHNKNMHVIYQGCTPPANLSVVHYKRFGVLALCDFSPRKNIARIMQAYSKLPKHIQKKHNLTVVVSMPHMERHVERLGRSYHITDTLTLCKHPPTAGVISLFERSAVFVYASLYEGFGLPIIEAMASGCPVITSNYGAMKEVAGNAAYLVDPKKITEISTALSDILLDPITYKTLSKKGLRRATSLRWEHTSSKTLQVYEKVFRS